jgi:hypothetical protein
MPRVAAGRVGAEVAHAKIQGEQDPPCCGCSRNYVRIERVSQAFTAHSIGIVTSANQYPGGRGGQVSRRA